MSIRRAVPGVQSTDLVHPGSMVDIGTGKRVRQLCLVREQSLDVGEPIDDKPWGIRRFGVLDPNGVRVTVLSHIG